MKNIFIVRNEHEDSKKCEKLLAYYSRWQTQVDVLHV